MSAPTQPAAAPPSRTPRSVGFILWGLVLLAAGYAWWRSSQADDEASGSATVESADSSDREPIELRPTIDGQRVSTAPPGAEVITHIPLPDFELTNQFGETVTLEDLKGRPWVASFIFVRCAGACPIMMGEMSRFRRELLDTDVRFVTFTVDPENDTPNLLQTYGANYGAVDEDWWLLTGDQEEIYDLILNGFEVLAQENYGADRLPGYEFAHSVGWVHVDAEGRMIGHYDSRELDERIALRRVLTGDIETPEENLVKRVIVPDERGGNAVEDSESSNESGEGATTSDDPDARSLPGWLARMPLVNAMLNSLATILLVAGYIAIKAKAKETHKHLMLTAFGVSIAFLACYLTYHFGRHHYLGSASATFPGTGGVRTVYLSILATHIVLAAIVPVLAIVTIVLGFRQRWNSHRRWANLTFPIWLYVSVTGVVIYVMNAAHGAYDAT